MPARDFGESFAAFDVNASDAWSVWLRLTRILSKTIEIAAFLFLSNKTTQVEAILHDAGGSTTSNKKFMADTRALNYK